MAHTATSSSSLARRHTVELGCNIRVTHPCAGDQYHMRIFTSSPSSKPSSDEKLYTFGVNDADGQACESLLIRMGMDSHPGLVHVFLFVTNDQESLGIRRTLMTGWGSVHFDALSLHKEYDLSLVDVTDAEQAVVTLHIQARVTPPFENALVPSLSSIKTGMDMLYQRIHVDIVDAYTRLIERGLRAPTPDRSNFYYVRTHMGKMPITTFAYLSTLVDQRGVEPLLQALLRRATDEIDIVERNSPTGSYDATRRNCETLVAMATMLPRGLHYTDDIRRTGRNRTEAVDQWSQLGTFPELATTGFDCEDGAGLVMSVLYLLRNMRFRDAQLTRMQAFANQYTPLFTLGNMKVGPGSNAETDYVPHAYVIMVDRTWFEGHLKPDTAVNGPFLPAMSLESTAYLSGVWDDRAMSHPGTSASRMVTTFDEIYREVNTAFEHIPNVLHAMRQYTPLQASNAHRAPSGRHRGSYEDIYVLMTVDHMNDRVAHCIVTHDSATRRTIGSLAEHVLRYAPDVHIDVVFSHARSYFESMYQCLWKQQPMNKLPTTAVATTANMRPAPNGVCGIIDIPSAVYTQHAHTIETALATMSKLYKCTTHAPSPLVGDIGFARVYITLGGVHTQ
jgi:hypothetical protein